ncbi:hypothetical protein KY360_02790 [Candidatus Woesearchaeota archaeon]|nr:hypothetical protein [Candidatus Woesearchaeota archaeon]
MALLTSMLEALNQIGASFTQDYSLWWYLAPVFLLWTLLELYFGKYKREKLGWNTSLGNGITLTWISVESMRFLFEKQPSNFWFKFGIIMAILLYAMLIVYFAFSHKLSAKVTYTLASPSPVYFLSAVTILWGHGVLIVTWWVLLDLVIIYILLAIIFLIIKKIMPESTRDMEGEQPPGLGGMGKEDLGLKDLKDLKI